MTLSHLELNHDVFNHDSQRYSNQRLSYYRNIFIRIMKPFIHLFASINYDKHGIRITLTC